MDIAQLPLHLQIEKLREVLSTNPTLLLVLQKAQELNAPNWYLAGGALSQTIWNYVSSMPPETGIRDYDLVYFDDSDLSYEAEDKVIKRGSEIFKDVAAEVEVRNQARVHLWYPEKHGVPCPKHRSVEAGIDTWISTTAMLGARLDGDSNWVIYAPRGLSDFFNMVSRPNTILGRKPQYDKKVARWRTVWPALKIEEWPAEDSSEK